MPQDEPQTQAPALQGQDPQAILEMLAAAGVLGDHPAVNLIAQLHQQRMLQQGISPMHPELGQSLMPHLPPRSAQKSEKSEKK